MRVENSGLVLKIVPNPPWSYFNPKGCPLHCHRYESPAEQYSLLILSPFFGKIGCRWP